MSFVRIRGDCTTCSHLRTLLICVFDGLLKTGVLRNTGESSTGKKQAN